MINNSLDYFWLKDWARFLIIAWLDGRNQNIILNYYVFLRLWNWETNPWTWEWTWNSEWNALVWLQAGVSLHWQASCTQLGGAAPWAHHRTAVWPWRRVLSLSALMLSSLVELGKYHMLQGCNSLEGWWGWNWTKLGHKCWVWPFGCFQFTHFVARIFTSLNSVRLMLYQFKLEIRKA